MAEPKHDAWMWKRAQELMEEADRLQRRFFHLSDTGVRAASWEPPVDLFETESALWVLVALPGVEPERVAVDIDGNHLTVSGIRGLPPALRSASVRRLEIPHGRFVRRVELPAPGYEIDRLELAHGCLTLELVLRGA